MSSEHHPNDALRTGNWMWLLVTDIASSSRAEKPRADGNLLSALDSENFESQVMSINAGAGALIIYKSEPCFLLISKGVTSIFLEIIHGNLKVQFGEAIHL